MIRFAIVLVVVTAVVMGCGIYLSRDDDDLFQSFSDDEKKAYEDLQERSGDDDK